MDDRTGSPLTAGPTINLPQEPTTVAYEAQDAKDDSEYQVLWSDTMEEGNYKSSTRYTNVVVLLLCWAEQSDDLTIAEEVNKLKKVFEERFYYCAQIGYLDASAKQTLQVQVNQIVANFVGSFDGPDTLLIVYYAGHGKPGNYYSSLELFGRISENDPQKRVDSLVWNKTENLLKDARADVFEIFDCCYAGNLSLTRGEHGLFEFLGATKEMATTPIPGPDSFTSALIYALETLVEEKGRFTTVEIVRKIMYHAPCFPKGQTPVLSDRKDEVEAGRIMLHPLHKTQKDGSAEEITGPDPFKRQTVTLHFDFVDQPSLTDIQTLGRQFNGVFERYALGVIRVRWGTMKQSAAGRAAGSFQASLKRSRRASMKRQQTALDTGATDRQSAGMNPGFLTPSSSSHSPRAMDFPMTQSTDAGSPGGSATSISTPLSSNDESDESHTPARKVRNKKQTSGMDGREASS